MQHVTDCIETNRTFSTIMLIETLLGPFWNVHAPSWRQATERSQTFMLIKGLITIPGCWNWEMMAMAINKLWGSLRIQNQHRLTWYCMQSTHKQPKGSLHTVLHKECWLCMLSELHTVSTADMSVFQIELHLWAWSLRHFAHTVMWHPQDTGSAVGAARSTLENLSEVICTAFAIYFVLWDSNCMWAPY